MSQAIERGERLDEKRLYMNHLWREKAAIASKVIAEEMTLAEAEKSFRALYAADPDYLDRLRNLYPDAYEEELVARSKAIIGDQSTYDYRRVWAMLKREGREKRLAPVNAKRVHRVMKAHGMLLQRHAGGADARRHDGKTERPT